MNSVKNSNEGHRGRIREKYQKHGLDVFQDYETIELLLSFVPRQKDVKKEAKELIKIFKSLQGLLDAEDEEILAVKNIGERTLTLIRFVKDCAAKYLQEKVEKDFSPAKLSNLVDVCKMKMGNLKDEEFRMFCLDTNFQIICEEKVTEGTIDQATVYPRKVIEIALKNNAKSLIFCHNHPDGNVEPSEYDKTMTKALQLAAKTVNIQIFDHLIVSTQDYYSFRDHQLL